MAGELNVRGVRQDPDLGAALQSDALRARRPFEQGDQGRMGDGAVQRAAAMEAIEAHRRPAAERDVAARLHVGRIGHEHEVELDGDRGRERLGRHERAAQVELLLGREDKMHGRAVG